jgi:hypothetical protein
MPVQRQDGYPENARWTKEGVVFATINAPGPNDNVPDTAESNARRPANVAWLNAAFDEAEATNAPGVMVVWQANPWQYNWNASWKYLTDVLRARTVAFGKPVVLVHGDTHIQRIDKGGKMNDDGSPDTVWNDKNWPPLANFTRVETFAGGPPAGGAGPLQPEKWIRATVDPNSPQVFSFVTETVPAASVP